MELDIREHLAKAKENQDFGALQSAYTLIKRTSASVARGPIPHVPPDIYIICAESALQLGNLEISSECLKKYFGGHPQSDQFLCRALLCQGQLKSLQVSPAIIVEDIKDAATYFLKAIEMSKKEPSTHFLVFNASVLYFRTVRPLLQPGRCFELVHSLKQVVESLEEVADQDHSWRAELMIELVKCLLDSGQVEDAASFAKVTENFIKSHSAHLYPKLYALQVRHKLAEDDVLLEASEDCNTFKVIYKIQEFKRWMELNEKTPTEEETVKLKEIFSLLVDSAEVTGAPVNSSYLQNPTPIQLCDRVEFLLELALVSLQVKHQNVAADCLKQLNLARKVNIDQRIIMECVKCEINLLKKDPKMNHYSKASVEARLKEIDKLDQLLQAAVREGRLRAVQAVCVTQWNLCLPLLQHNLRKRIKTPLFKLAQVLEDIQSMLLEVRCGVHSELAGIEEEEGNIEASLSHLQKALMLDNGTQQQHLSSAFKLLQLRRTLYQTPACPEDKAAMLMQQVRDIPPQNSTERRPILLSVGLLLAPNVFQTLVDAESASTFSIGSTGSELMADLAAKAQHHSICVEGLNGYLGRQSKDEDYTARVKLWAMLAKTARKQEVWDVCRAACRFCLLYDDGPSTSSKKKEHKRSGEKSSTLSYDGHCGNKKSVLLLRLFAEICFISAEATVYKLLEEGVKLNSPVVPPQGKVGGATDEDPHWVVYRDWIQGLSAYATSSFLRGGEIGVEICESWLVENAAIYLWNYNNHILAAGEYHLLLPTFQNLLKMFQRMKAIGNHTLYVILCDAVARGLIQPLVARDCRETSGNSRAGKKTEPASTHGVHLDHAALQDVRRASELCDFALRTSSCFIAAETVPVAARKRVLTTWMQIKRLLHQQQEEALSSSTLEIFKDESVNEEVAAMNRVLVGLEMLHSNKNPRHMEVLVPSLSALACMASECSWSDAVVELQVWCQLAAFCHHVNDHSLVLRCTQTALQLEEAAAKSFSTTPCLLYGTTAVGEMLSIAACLRGLSLVCKSDGNPDDYREALNVFLSSVSFAEKADSQELCVTAAGHFWNACLPLTQSLQDRWWLKEHLEKILNALIHTRKYNKHNKKKRLVIFSELPLETSKRGATNDGKELGLIAAITGLLVRIQNDKEDYAYSLHLLDKAISEMPRTKHRLPLLEYRMLLKARVGESIEYDIQMLQDESGQSCSLMWHKAAQCATTLNQQLTCYQKAITSLMSTESQWQKVKLLLEFGSWLYFHNFPTSEAQIPVQWAIDILLHLGPEQASEPDDKNLKTETNESVVGVHGQFTQNLSSLKQICRMDQLIGAHTLLALMSDRTSSEHKHNLLLAFTFVLQIWQVSVTTACEIFSEMMKSQPASSLPSDKSKKSKEKGKDKKTKDTIPAQERQNSAVMDQTLPSTTREWAEYICPEQTRQIFKTTSSPHCINKHSFLNQYQSLFYLRLLEKELRSLSLDHLTLPILHLAEIIAHDLLERQSLSDLYRLRIVNSCAELGFDSHPSYQEQLQSLSKIQELEQIRCHKDMIHSQEWRRLGKKYNQKIKLDEQKFSEQLSEHVSSQNIWLEKAEVCLSLGLYQSARQLLAEAHMVAREFGDKSVEAESLLGLAALACKEQNYAMAQILLDKAQILKGDHDFWYHLTLIRVTAVMGHRDQAWQTKVGQVIKQGCEALQLIAGLQVNRAAELKSMNMSLEKRGAVECIKAIAEAPPAEEFSTEDVQRLMAACDTLRESADGLTKLSCGQQAAEAHRDCAYGLRLLSSKVNDIEKKQRYLLDALTQMQLAVVVQEQVVLSAQRLFVPQENFDLSMKSIRKLVLLRVGLTEFCLGIFKEHVAEQTHRALARLKKTSTEIALEEFTRSSPQPGSTEMEWQITSRTLGQTILSQLAAVSFQSSDNMEIRARCLSLMGKYLRLMAVQEEPMYVRDLWLKREQEAWPGSEGLPTSDENFKKRSDSIIKEEGIISTRSAELQREGKAQQLLAEARKALSESISLCLQHNLPYTILSEASLDMLECHGKANPTVTGQYLALYQSCCTVAMAADVLRSACADTSLSQLSALLSLHRNLFFHQERSPSIMLRGMGDPLLKQFKAFSQLTISPSHLSILSEIPPNIKIFLLQHSDDGAVLYGGFFETIKDTENRKGKTRQLTGPMTCSQVAKVSVCPQALVALREQTQVFGLENKHSVGRDESSQLETSELHQKTTRDTEIELHFSNIVEKMENYLNPLLSQFDFSFIRSQVAPLLVTETSKSKIKDEKCSSEKVEPEEHLVILADRKLLELPLEALPFLQKEGLTSLSRDFSLQLFFNRLKRQETQKVESDNKKETKGGKGTKGKADQSKAIKAVPTNPVLPSYTIKVDTSDLKCFVYPYKEGHFEETCQSRTMKELLETLKQHLSHHGGSFINCNESPSLSDMEQMLCRCSAFIYMGTDPMLTVIPASKLAAFNLTECHMALLFDRVQSRHDDLFRSNAEKQKRAGRLTLDTPLETALLLSLNGVGCIVLNQWHSTFKQRAHDLAAVLDSMLRVRQTSGQTVYALRGWKHSDMSHHKVTETYDQVLTIDSKEDEVQHTPAAYNCILYGLPNLIAT